MKPDDGYRHPATDEEDNRPHNDYCWVMGSEEVRSAYGGRIVAVNHKKIWGAGETDFDALADAQAKPGCPHRLALTFVSVPLDYSDALGEESLWRPVAGLPSLEQPSVESPQG